MRNIELYSLLDVHGIKDENAKFHDFSSNDQQGTVTGATQVLGRDGQAIRCVSASSQYVDFGDIGTIRSVAFWILLDTATEKILQLSSSVSIEASSGSISLTGFTAGNVYVDGIDTATIGSNAWHHVCIVDTSDITADAFEVGRFETSAYGDITICQIKAFSVSLAADEAEFLARRPSRSIIVSPTRRIWTPLSLNGSGYASHADDPALHFGVGDFAFGGWFNTNRFSEDYGYIMNHGLASLPWVCLRLVAATGKVEFFISESSLKYATSASSIFGQGWIYCFAVADRDGNAQIYLKGVADGSAVNISSEAGDIFPARTFYVGQYDAGTYHFSGRIALLEKHYFGYGGLPTAAGVTPADYARWRTKNPYRPMSDGPWAGYADALYTDIHNGAGSVTGLVVGMWYEFTQGTGGHNLTGGGTLSTTGVFQATATTADISSGDGSDHVRRTGVRGNWSLNGNLLDRTSNALDLTAGGSGNQFPPDFILPTLPQTEFYEPLTDESLTKRWVVASGSFEPIYDSTQLTTSCKCLSAGNIFISVADTLRDRSESQIEISWLMKKAATTTPYLQFIANKPLDRAGSGSQGYYFIMDADEGVGFYRYNANSYTELFDTGASYVNVGQWYRIKFSITATGVYAGYIDDVQIAETSGNNPTGTETTYTNFSYIVLGMGIDDEMAKFKVRRT